MKRLISLTLTILILYATIGCGEVLEQATTESEVEDHAITTGDVQDQATTESEAQDQAITTGEVQDQITTTGEVEDQTTTTSEVEDQATTTSEVQDQPTNTIRQHETGMYNPDYDYSALPRYKVAYIVLNNTHNLYTSYGTAYEHWASLMNVEYQGLIDFAGDGDELLGELSALAHENDGLIIDAGENMLPRIKEIMDVAGTPWMSNAMAPRDSKTGGTTVLHPGFNYDHYTRGGEVAAKLLEYRDKLWPDVPDTEFGFITTDYSISPLHHQRALGAGYKIEEIAPHFMNENRYFVVDLSVVYEQWGQKPHFDNVDSYAIHGEVIEVNPQIRYWLVFAQTDDMALSAADVLDYMGYAETSFIASSGTSKVPHEQWENSSDSAWKAVYDIPMAIYAELAIGALHAFMAGWATPETIWPEWVNVNDSGGEGHTYASRIPPMYWIDCDNYREVLKWFDIYAGTDYFPEYPIGDLTRYSYSTVVEVPDYYSERIEY